MIEYYLFLFVVIIFASIYNKNPNVKFFLYAVLVVMTLFAGLRSAEVGTDASGYARVFEERRNYLDGRFIDILFEEPAFFYLNKILGMLSNQYWVLFTGIALLTYSCVLTAIKRETNNIVVPLFIFITLGLYTFVFNAARQGIAVGIYMLSFKYLLKDYKMGFFKYCSYVLFAAMFHKTVIIALPLYYLFRLKYSIKVLIFISILGFCIGAILPKFLSFASTQEARYALYSTKASGGELLTFFYIFITAYFIFQRNYIDDKYMRKYDVFLNMMLFGTLIYIVVQLTEVYVEMTRFAAYFQVAAIFLWAYIFQSECRPKRIYSFVICIGHMIYYFIFCSKMAALTPYMFNPKIF